MRLSQTDEWRAGCAERCKSGSERGVGKRAALWENQSWSQPMQRALLLLYRHFTFTKERTNENPKSNNGA